MNSGAKILTHEQWCEFSHPCAKNFQFVHLTSDDHNFFVQTPFEVFLDSMESSLSQESRFMHVEGRTSGIHNLAEI